MIDYHKLSIKQMLDKLELGEVTSRQLTEFYLEESNRLQGKINGYITITPEHALKTATKVDRARQAGRKLSVLAGIPGGIKDNISTKGVRTTCASKITENYIPPFDAHVMELLADSPMLGKVSLDEFAMGSANESSYFGPVSNPWDLDRVPGGSSGGSAALVAAGSAPFTLGTDTGGSIRQPAAFCGVTGIKPTYGRVSRRGLVAFASSLDQIGPIARTVEDCAFVLQAISGYDPGDATSADLKVPDFTASLINDVKGMRIGIPTEILSDCPKPSIAASINDAAKILEQAGATLVDVSMPYEKEALAAYFLVGTAEASSNLARFDGLRFGYRGEGNGIQEVYESSRKFGDEVRRRIMLGTFALSTDACGECYARGQQARKLIMDHFSEMFKEVDVLLMPTSPSTAFKKGEKKDPLAMYYNDIYAIPANLAGLPAISVPCGLDNGLPLGMQFMAPKFREDLIIQAAHTWQCLTDWHLMTPREVE